MITYNDSSTVEICGNSFQVIMHAVDHYITLNGPIQVAHLVESLIDEEAVCLIPAGSYLRLSKIHNSK